MHIKHISILRLDINILYINALSFKYAVDVLQVHELSILNNQYEV